MVLAGSPHHLMPAARLPFMLDPAYYQLDFSAARSGLACFFAVDSWQSADDGTCRDSRKVGVTLPEKSEFKLPWHEAGSLDHHDDIVDSDQ